MKAAAMNPAYENTGPPAPSADQYNMQQHPMSPPPAFSPHHTGTPLQTAPVTFSTQQPKMEQQWSPNGHPQQQQYYQQSPPAGQPQQGTYFPPQGQPQPGQPQYGMQEPNRVPYQNATPLGLLNMSSAPVDCPRCQQRALTNITYHSGNTTHAWAAGLCCFTGLFCFVPYLMNSMKDIQHRCSKCGTLLATWHKSGAVEIHAHA